jgi:hypothetical protein
MASAIGPPDSWQTELLEGDFKRVLLLCSRQSGKSSTVAVIAAYRAFTSPGSDIVIVSSTQVQASEMLRRVSYVLRMVNVKYVQHSVLRIELSNGSRVLALASNEQSVRGYSKVALVIIDEAARVSDELYYTLTPMLAVSDGDLMALTTPFGARGWFWAAWTQDPEEDWYRVTVTASECPRLSADFLTQERRRMGELWYRQEYECQFIDATHSIFKYELIHSLVRNDIEASIWKRWVR